MENAPEVEDGMIFPKSAFRLFTTTAATWQYKPKNNLRAWLVNALTRDMVAQQHRNMVDVDQPTTKNDAIAPRHRSKHERSWTWDDDLLLYDNLIYVPDDNALRLEIMRMHHDDALAGHYGVAKTLELVSRNYYFPGMAAYVKKYIDTCDTCA